MWALFVGVVLVLLAMDLGLFNRKSKEISIKNSLLMSAFYVSCGVAYGIWVWYGLGPVAGKEYFTGFIVEKILSLDNIFVISLIFSYFSIPAIYQHRVLFFGILGVIILRGIMISLGAMLVAKFHWLLYVFAVFLMFTGIKMLFAHEKEKDMGANPILKLLKKIIPITDNLHGNKFFVRLAPQGEGQNKTIAHATPLFVALIMIEFVDLVFAVDSVPAIFAITTDSYVIYTSNIFAILGLRALYFTLAAMIHRFAYLKYALSGVLVFIGSKIFIGDWFFDGKMPAELSLAVTVLMLSSGIIVSLLKTRPQAKAVQGE
ncbi:MAG: TerC family protein [Alphaproteobacteria bacterium]